MSDLISRSALLAKMKQTSRFFDVKFDIEEAPAVDAVPVVRCKYCKHYRHYGRTSLLIDGENKKAGWCQRRIRYDEEHRMLPDDFCSYGERRADGNDE